MKVLSFVIFMIAIFTLPARAFEIQGNNFVFAQLKYSGDWDPYPEIWAEIHEFLKVATTITSLKERRIVALSDHVLFYSPFVAILGKGEFPPLSKAEAETLRAYMIKGGIVFAEDSSSLRRGSFDNSFRREIMKVFPELKLKSIAIDHPLYRSYYFLRRIAGRKINSSALEVLEYKGRVVLIYSQNDVLGTWARNRFGNYIHECFPGGEAQRFESQKLTLNIIMFSLTGTYKSDSIHRPFLKMKE